MINPRRIVLALSLLSLLPYCLLHIFNYPSADDFWYANYAGKMSFLEVQRYFYTSWTGRFISTLLLTNSPVANHNLAWYALASITNMLLLWVATFYACWQISKILKLSKFHAELSLLVLAALMSHLPSTREGLYWYAGFVNYTIPLAAFVVLLPLFLRALIERRFNAQNSIIAALAGFWISGSNEALMLQYLGLLSVGLIASVFYKRSLIPALLFPCFVTFISSLVVFLAPGNQVRSAHFQPGNPIVAVIKSVGGTVEHFVQFLNLPLLFLILLIWRACIDRLVTINPQILPGSWRKWALFSFVFINLGFVPSYVKLGGSPADRADNMFYWFYGFFSFIVALKVFEQHQKFVQGLFTRWPFLTLPRLITAFFISLFAWDNTRTAWNDLAFKAIPFSRQIQERQRTIIESNDTIVKVPRIQNEPTTFFVDDLVADGMNENFASYFKKNGIRVESLQ